MRQPDAPRSASESWERRVRDGWVEMESFVDRHGLREKARPFPVEGYACACDAGPNTLGVLALFDGEGKIAGGIMGGTIYLYEPHRGKGIGTEMMIIAFNLGIKRVNDCVILSTEGRRTRRSAHRKAVERALAAGIEVDARVLADYPEMQAGVAAAAP